MAMIANSKGDYFSGQEFSLNATKYFNHLIKDQHLYIVANLNVLGQATYNLNHYSQAIDSYQEALKFSTTTEIVLKLQNNIANALRREKKYEQAIAIYQNILKQHISSTEFARVLSNFALTKWLQNPTYNAAPALLKALKIRESENSPIEKNASYSNLADYYFKKRPDSSLFYAQKMYQVAKITNDPDDKLQALQKLIKLAPPQLAKSYFENYANLDDSVQTARSTAKNQFAFIRFGVEKSKTAILRLEKDNTAKKYQIVTRELVIIGTLLLFIALAIIFTLWYKKRKQKMETDAQDAIRNNQLKISKKVHDVVANGLYKVMAEMENQPKINKENILDKIEALYEKSRDISYEKPETNLNDFQQKVSELLRSFASENTKILIAGNSSTLWDNVNVATKYELEHILQELMVNMKKHSKATNVAVKFELLNQRINIYYTDNGIGTKNLLFKNGLTNTGNRINHIHGNITFDTNNGIGLKIHISFPLA